MKNYCLTCGHICHCVRILCFCSCKECSHIYKKETSMIKKIWNKIVSWLFSWQKK